MEPALMDQTQQPSATEHKAADLVTLNVGGTLYTTTVAILTHYPDSMLGRMFSDRIPPNRDSDGHYIIDGDGPIFRHVLNFLRRSSLCLPQYFQDWDLLSAEANFFQIQKLIDAVKSLKEKRSGEGSRQKTEFIEVGFLDTYCDVRYSGTLDTLKAIPTLWLVYRYCTDLKDNLVGDHANNRSGKINRMKIMGEITELGFRLLNTSTIQDEFNQMHVILFGRDTL